MYFSREAAKNAKKQAFRHRGTKAPTRYEKAYCFAFFATSRETSRASISSTPAADRECILCMGRCRASLHEALRRTD
jgi:hypothetical protein